MQLMGDNNCSFPLLEFLSILPIFAPFQFGFLKAYSNLLGLPSPNPFYIYLSNASWDNKMNYWDSKVHIHKCLLEIFGQNQPRDLKKATTLDLRYPNLNQCFFFGLFFKIFF
jgi:hypothetical protein